MSNFSIINEAVATQNRTSSNRYLETLSELPISAKQENGTFAGAAIECEKAGQVLSFREAAKRMGVGLVTRKQADGKVRVWKINKADMVIRHVSATKTPKAKKAAKAKA